jgi:hypothetical protein
MKTIRPPWIRCRADEVDSIRLPMTWDGITFEIVTYSEQEGREWWSTLGDRERQELLGVHSAQGESDALLNLF